MKKVVSPCFCKVYTRSGNEATARAFCKIQFENGRLSITGVIGPLRSGGHRGSAGQCVDEIREGCPCDEWTREMLDKFCSMAHWDGHYDGYYDGEPVVRCKDCEHFKNYGKTSLLADGKNIKAGWCYRRIRYDEEYRMPPDGFCSYGKRRNGGNGNAKN